MEFVYHESLDGLLTSIESTMVAVIPKVVGKLAIAEPVYAVVLWYHDSSVVDYVPSIGILTHRVRDACATQYKSDSVARIDCLWRPQQTLEEHSLVIQHSIAEPRLRNQCNEAYSLMLAANTSPLPLPDERDILMPFRSMMRRVARRLAVFDWKGILVTDESFVAVALDSIGDWLREDLREGLSSAERDKLVRRGHLFADLDSMS